MSNIVVIERIPGWPENTPKQFTDAERVAMLLRSIKSLRHYITFDFDGSLSPGQFERMLARADNRIAECERFVQQIIPSNSDPTGK